MKGRKHAFINKNYEWLLSKLIAVYRKGTKYKNVQTEDVITKLRTEKKKCTGTPEEFQEQQQVKR